MSSSQPLPLSIYLVVLLIQARLNSQGLAVPPSIVVEAVREQPELFHYRATRSGRLLAWDLQYDNALKALEHSVPELAHAARDHGLEQSVPFAAFNKDGPLHESWMHLIRDLDEPILDTTHPDTEPIFGGPVDLPVLTQDAILEHLHDALQLPEGPERTRLVARYKDLLSDMD